MKKIFLLLVLAAGVAVSYGQVTAANASAAVKPEFATLEWAGSTHDFGKVLQGTPVTHEFRFTNKGTVPLVITNVAASCGCTTPDWSREPIAPGQEGFIKATYNAAALGAFSKTVTVTANVENGYVQLMIKGEVANEIKQ